MFAEQNWYEWQTPTVATLFAYFDFRQPRKPVSATEFFHSEWRRTLLWDQLQDAGNAQINKRTLATLVQHQLPSWLDETKMYTESTYTNDSYGYQVRGGLDQYLPCTFCFAMPLAESMQHYDIYPVRQSRWVSSACATMQCSSDSGCYFRLQQEGRREGKAGLLWQVHFGSGKPIPPDNNNLFT